MTKLLVPLLALLLLVPVATASAAKDPKLPVVHPIDLSKATSGGGRLPDLGAKPKIPGWMRAWQRRGDLHAADHWAGVPNVREEKFQDEHGHVLTFATDGEGVDLSDFARILASTYHHGEIELVHVFVTDTATLEENCGSDAAACYGADPNGPGGVMIVSYEDSDVVHGMVHEYGHHIDNNRYNLGGLSDCGTNGDGSRRWFFARQMQDRILDHLSCDPEPGWGQLLPEVYAEDYAQMAGIPRDEYHPAIVVRPPSDREKAKLRKDIDRPFLPSGKNVRGRSSRSGTARFTVKTSLPVFLAARKTKNVRSVRVKGCSLRGFKNAFSGTCKVTVKTKKRRQRFSFRLAIF